MKYWIWLSGIIGFGSSKLKSIFSKFGSAENVYNTDISILENCGMFSLQEIKRFSNKSLSRAEKIIAECEKSGIGIVAFDDNKYPERLKNIDNPPCCLYYKGRLPEFDKLPVISIVGTRKADEYSQKAAWSLSARLSLANCLIISGGAVGIDSAAHRGCLDVGADTVALLACGINHPYLKENEGLRHKISENGCLISEFPPDYSVKKTSFHLRNRLISGLSLGVVVIEAGEKSGALITARNAAEQGRDVFVITGKPDDKKYMGSNMLLRDGAIPVFKFEDILSEYYIAFGNIIDVEKARSFNLSKLYNTVCNSGHISEKYIKYSESDNELPKENKKIFENQNLTLSKNAEIVYNYLNSDFFTVDDLTETELTVTDIFTAVTELELLGIIKAVPGGRYTKI